MNDPDLSSLFCEHQDPVYLGHTCPKCAAWPLQAAALEAVVRPDTPAWAV